jgi:transposase InsO family protein
MRFGEAGLLDRPSAPHRPPTATPARVIARIEALRRERMWSARGITFELAGEGVVVSVRTVSRQLVHLGLNRRRFLDATYLHTAIDGYSRLAYTEALPDETARTAIGFTHRARAFFARHGIGHVHRIVTDNGSCYRAEDFATVLRGARHQRITPYTPRHNGKVERYHRILAEELLYARTWTSEHHRSAALAVWHIHYN